MIKKLFSVLLVLVMFFSIFTVAVAVDEEDYDVILLPVISDQLEQNKQVTQVQLYIDKKTNTAFVDLDVICELIGANCNYKKDWYIVDRDYTYFKYKGSGDMKLYLSHTDSGLLLLEGDLFESRMINNRWYVDYIKFCDMYGVKLQKIDSSIKSYITDDRFGDCYKKYINFEKNPYYIQMDTGVTLSSIYGEIIENKERYFWDYSSWSADDDSDIISKVLLSEAGISVGVQGGNLFSNIINDWDGFTSAIFSDYESDEHYTEALTDICNVKYINNAVKYKIDDPCKNDTMADTLQKGLTLWSTYDMYNESTEFFDKLLETNDYKEIFSSTDKSLKFEDIFSSVSKVGLNAVQKYCEQLMLCKRLNNISETKINMLQKGILENDSILNKAKNQEKVNDIITAIGKNPVNINNALIPDNLKIRNPFSKIYLNTFNNSEGLKESAQKMSNMYKNVDEQKKDKFNKIIETVKFSVSDEMIQTVFKNSGSAELSGFAFAMGIFDGMMGIAKTEFGEQLKQLEKLAQYYYIEKTLLNDLDEKNPENLYNRLLFALEASLCCFQSSSDESENEIKAITEVLLELDYDTEKLNINYYHDPRNNNVSNDIKEAILNYQAVIKDNNTINEEQLKKYEKIYKDYVDSEAWRTYEDSAGNGTITNNGRLVVKYTEIFDFDGDSIPEMLLYTYNPSSTPKEESHTLFCTIKNDKVETLLSANSVGGTLDGNRVEISYDKKENNFVVGLSGHVGGFGGNSYFEEWYKYNSGLIDKTIEYHSIEFSNKNNGSDKYTVNGNSVSKNILSVTEDRFCRVDYEDLPLLFDSPDREKLLKEQENPSILYSDRIQKYNGQVYYTTGEDIGSQFAVNYDFSYLGYKILPVNKSVLDFIIYNDRIYYIYVEFGLDLKFNLMSCDLFGKNSETIAENVEENFIIKDNILQFSVSKNDYGRTYNNYNIDTGEITAVSYENILIYYSGKISEGHVFDGGYYYYVYPDVSEEYGVLKADERIYRRDNKTGEVCEVGKRWHQVR